MKRKIITTINFILLLFIATGTLLMAADITETEPNDTPAMANPIMKYDTMIGAIDPVGDVDYYSLDGMNTNWGFIALLDSSNAMGSNTAKLDALGTDGSTVLQSDTGSWENGSGIALQNYADDNATHYLRVTESGDNETIDNYTLRYIRTIVNAQPEIEPNDDPATGTPSGYTHDGVVNPVGDVDCFLFDGKDGSNNYLFALNSDPENDGTTANLVLELRDLAGGVLKKADVSGAGGNEFIQYESLPAGAHAYCVYEAVGGGSASATYKVGLVQNEQLYVSAYQATTTWLDPRPGGYAEIGDELTFQFSITNTSPIPMLDLIDVDASFDDACLSLVSASPTPESTSSNRVSWYGQKDGLAAGEIYTTTVVLKAEAICQDYVTNGLGLQYFFTGTVRKAEFNILVLDEHIYLPAILRSGQD